MHQTLLALASCLALTGCSSNSKTLQEDVLAHFAASGYPLREVPCDSSYMEHYYRVGPDYEFAVAMNFLDAPKEETGFDPQEFPIPSYTKHNVILWQWNLDQPNGTREYTAFYEKMKTVLDSYPGSDG